MNKKNIFFYILVAISIAGFVAFVGKYDDYLERKHKNAVEEHAEVVASSVWFLFTSFSEEYLKLAVKHNKYKSFVVYASQKDPIISIENSLTDSLDRFFYSIGLIDTPYYKTPIQYQKENIGKVEVIIYDFSIYVFINVFLLIILTHALIWFMIKLFEERKNLQFKVKEKTVHLEESNRQLVSEINERKRVADELRISQQTFKGIFSGMQEAYFRTDVNGKISMLNPAALHTFGYEHESELLSVSMVDLYFDPLERESLIGELISEGKVVNREVAMKKKSGEKVLCLINVQILQIQGGERVFEAIIRDFTDKKRTEEIMVQSEKMMSLGGLAAGMAHEINNPLAVVLQNAQILKKRLMNPTTKNIEKASEYGIQFEKMKDFMEQQKIGLLSEGIIDAGKRAAEIVKNMLSFARKKSEEKEKCDLKGLLERTLDLATNDYNLKKHYDFRKIKVERSFPEYEISYLCEPSKLQQVFLNILKNGAEAMFEKQYGEGESPTFFLSIFIKENQLKVTIEDNGPGIDEEVRKRIFEPFYTTKGIGKGTGLGMSISYFIIQDTHHGNIEVESEKGKWTRFTITLPCLDSEKKHALLEDSLERAN